LIICKRLCHWQYDILRRARKVKRNGQVGWKIYFFTIKR
jgi:hypothetical protein